jgi:hypothetical protein
MNEMDRREFLLGTAQAVGGVVVYSLLGETAEAAPAEGAATVDEPEDPDEEFWAGGY